MNLLLLGHKTLPELRDNFLLIHGGEISLTVPDRKKVTVLDFQKDSLDPLKDMTYLRAREFISVLDAVFPAGANTLTRENANYLILEALLDRPTKLSKLLRPSKDPHEMAAYRKIQTILLSPVLSRFLNRPTNFSLDGVVIAKIDRGELGDFDALMLSNILMSFYPHQIVCMDFGFHGREHHSRLIRENRLIAGVNFLAELPLTLQNEVLLMPRVVHRATYEDAVRVLNQEGKPPTMENTHDLTG